MKVFAVNIVVLMIALCEGQVGLPPALPPVAATQRPKLHNGLTDKIGNFSIELLYHTAKLQNSKTNLILSPITLWTVLAVTAEGASGNTLVQINKALRVRARNLHETRAEFANIAQWLVANTNNVELAKINAIFVDNKELPEKDFIDDAAKFYDTRMISLDFTKAEESATVVNNAISQVTHGRISKLIDSSTLGDSRMILTSALYFKGAWTLPFNSSNTSKLPFFTSDGKKMGEVNMMYNRHTYPFANIENLKARIIELPYGSENRLSMLVMLPHPGVSLEDMFLNFSNVTLDTVFEELRIAKEDYSEDEVDCFLPRFKIESDLDMTPILKESLGIVDLFDSVKARLPLMARTPVYVSKIIHKAEIEVTEEGTTASGVTVAEYSNRFGVVRFEANRPFAYMIIEKITNSIVFGGLYQEPSLY